MNLLAPNGCVGAIRYTFFEARRSSQKTVLSSNLGWPKCKQAEKANLAFREWIVFGDSMFPHRYENS